MTATIEYTTIDKAAWGDGPWKDEPDKRQWRDETTGLPCLAVRHAVGGHWCGYVGVPPGHPWHGLKYSDEGLVASVHGGLTFTSGCQHEADPSIGVCHIPGEGETDDLWWLGFDCAHAFDLAPGHVALMASIYSEMPAPIREARQAMSLLGHLQDEYRTLEYVEKETADLAWQAYQVGQL